MENLDPNKIDPTLLYQKFNGINDALQKAISGMGGAVSEKTIFESVVVEKSYPFVMNNKKGVLNVTKNKDITIKVEGITDEEIKLMIKKIHD